MGTGARPPAQNIFLYSFYISPICYFELAHGFLLICVWVLVLLCDVAWVHAQTSPSSLKVTTKFECAKDICKQRSFVQPSRRHDSIDNPEKIENMEHLIKGCLHIHSKLYFSKTRVAQKLRCIIRLLFELVTFRFTILCT